MCTWEAKCIFWTINRFFMRIYIFHLVYLQIVVILQNWLFFTWQNNSRWSNKKWIQKIYSLENIVLFSTYFACQIKLFSCKDVYIFLPQNKTNNWFYFPPLMYSQHTALKLSFWPNYIFGKIEKSVFFFPHVHTVQHLVSLPYIWQFLSTLLSWTVGQMCLANK